MLLPHPNIKVFSDKNFYYELFLGMIFSCSLSLSLSLSPPPFNIFFLNIVWPLLLYISFNQFYLLYFTSFPHPKYSITWVNNSNPKYSITVPLSYSKTLMWPLCNKATQLLKFQDKKFKLLQHESISFQLTQFHLFLLFSFNLYANHSYYIFYYKIVMN